MGDLARARDRGRRDRPVRTGHSLDWIAVSSRQMVEVVRNSAPFRRELAASHRAVRSLGWRCSHSRSARLDHHAREFLPAFSSSTRSLHLHARPVGEANDYNLGPPLLALALGLVMSNGRATALARCRLPRRVLRQDRHSAPRCDLPFTLIVWAGPAAILQASIVSFVTSSVIFTVGTRSASTSDSPQTLGAGRRGVRRLGLDRDRGAVGGAKKDASHDRPRCSLGSR